MKKALYLHGFLGGPDDMRPLFIKDYECESVDVRLFLNKPEEILKRYKGPYDFSVAYSYGGRLLAKCLELKPDFVARPLFCSTRITSYTEKEIVDREQFKIVLLEKLEASFDDFIDFWRNLALFDGHSMNKYRKEYDVEHKPWDKELISLFLEEHFTYSAPKLTAFESRSWYLYGEKDQKYKNESLKLKMDSYGFLNCGHRFLFEDVDLFTQTLKTRVLD